MSATESTAPIIIFINTPLSKLYRYYYNLIPLGLSTINSLFVHFLFNFYLLTNILIPTISKGAKKAKTSGNKRFPNISSW